MPKILPVIMCGGSGTRMWPLSRESLPKQFISLIGERSSFQDTLAMLDNADVFLPPVVLTNHDYRFLVSEQMEAVGIKGEIVLEPVRRDSGPAVAAAAELALLRVRTPLSQCSPPITPSKIRKASPYLLPHSGRSRLRGVYRDARASPRPSRDRLWLYSRGAPVNAGSDVRKVEAFVEKPDAKTAERYVGEGYLWNSGNFIFRADTMRDEVQRFEPEMAVAAMSRDQGKERS